MTLSPEQAASYSALVSCHQLFPTLTTRWGDTRCARYSLCERITCFTVAEASEGGGDAGDGNECEVALFLSCFAPI